MRCLAPLLCCFLLAACGEEGLDRSDPMAVFTSAMAAVHDGDWAHLKTLLTKDARMEMARDLERLKRRLGHDVDGEQERTLARQRLGDAAPDAIARVIAGGPGEGLRFFVALMPRERQPPTKGVKVAPTTRSVLYALEDGTLREVRLVLQGGRWSIVDLQL